MHSPHASQAEHEGPTGPDPADNVRGGGPRKAARGQRPTPDLPRSARSAAGDDLARSRANRNTLLWAVRVAFVTLVVVVTLLNVLEFGRSIEPGPTFTLGQYWWGTLLAAIGIAAVFVVIDLITPNKKLATFSGILFGIVGGLIVAVAVGFVLDLVARSWGIEGSSSIVDTIKVIFGIALVFLGVSTVLQTQDDFRLVVPYVEFSKQIRGPKPLILDSSALIDARIADVAQTGILQAPLIVPSFIITELQTLADSADPMKRARGRRGLDIISRIRQSGRAGLSIDETPIPEQTVDLKLVELARTLPGMLVTGDLALSRIADIQGVPVININELARALKHSVIPGETLTLRLVKPGEQPGQGVGYLEDGTMVVAEDGEPYIDRHATMTVKSSLQTAAGRLIFARIAHEHPPEQPQAPGRAGDPGQAASEPGAPDPTSKPGPKPGPNPDTTQAVTQARTGPDRQSQGQTERQAEPQAEGGPEKSSTPPQARGETPRTPQGKPRVNRARNPRR